MKVFLIIFIVAGMIAPGFTQSPPEAKNQPLRRGIETLQLGKTLEEIQRELRESPHFLYRGPRDVSFLPMRPETVIDTEGTRFISRGIFQFQGGILVSLILYLNPRFLEYPILFQHLSSRYGPPLYMDPRSSYWEDNYTRIMLERPLTVKFVERSIVSREVPSVNVPLSPETLARQDFLDLF